MLFDFVELLLGEFIILKLIEVLFVKNGVDNSIVFFEMGLNFKSEFVFEKICLFDLISVRFCLIVFFHERKLGTDSFLKIICLGINVSDNLLLLVKVFLINFIRLVLR